MKCPRDAETRLTTRLTLVGPLKLAGRGIVTGVALLMSGAAFASAATDLGTVDGTSYVGGTSSGSPPASAATDLHCPDDTRPVGAGFSVAPPNVVHDAYPADLFDPFGPGALESVRVQAWMASGPSPEIYGWGSAEPGLSPIASMWARFRDAPRQDVDSYVSGQSSPPRRWRIRRPRLHCCRLRQLLFSNRRRRSREGARRRLASPRVRQQPT